MHWLIPSPALLSIHKSLPYSYLFIGLRSYSNANRSGDKMCRNYVLEQSSCSSLLASSSRLSIYWLQIKQWINFLKIAAEWLKMSLSCQPAYLASHHTMWLLLLFLYILDYNHLKVPCFLSLSSYKLLSIIFLYKKINYTHHVAWPKCKSCSSVCWKLDSDMQIIFFTVWFFIIL